MLRLNKEQSCSSTPQFAIMACAGTALPLLNLLWNLYWQNVNNFYLNVTDTADIWCIIVSSHYTKHFAQVLELYLLTFRWPCIVINSYNKTNQMHKFFKFIFGVKLYMFWTVPLSVIRSSLLYTQQWYMSYRFADSLTVCKLSANLLCVQWRTPDDWQKNCLKYVEFYSKK